MVRQISEEHTRKGMIDPQLSKVGCYLHAVQSAFLRKRHLETADASTSLSASLYEPPLDSFGVDAVDGWFTEKEVEEVVAFANKMAV